MSEVKLKPIETEDDDGNPIISFTEDHTVRDVIRYLLSTGVGAGELVHHIYDITFPNYMEKPNDI
jgi:hypothetical protein